MGQCGVAAGPQNRRSITAGPFTLPRKAYCAGGLYLDSPA